MKKQGFTLAEAIMSVAIISILSVIVFPIIVQSLAVNRTSSNKTKATDRAVTKIEELRKKSFDDPELAIGNHNFNISPLVLIGGSGQIRITDDLNGNGNNTDPDEGSDIKKVTIVIKWKEGSRTNQTALSTYIAKNGMR